MIALDATNRKRPNNEKIEDLIAYIRNKEPNCLLMADISNEDEAIRAADLGFDCISTTLIGYTKETVGVSLFDESFLLLKSLVNSVNVPIIAEGKMSTPALARSALTNGAYAVVVGSAITRPKKLRKLSLKNYIKFSYSHLKPGLFVHNDQTVLFVVINTC